jgi:hypothetical protein
MISAKVAPFLRRSMATTWAVLLPLRGAVTPPVLAARLPLGAFLALVAFLVTLAVASAPLAAREERDVHRGLRRQLVVAEVQDLSNASYCPLPEQRSLIKRYFGTGLSVVRLCQSGTTQR